MVRKNLEISTWSLEHIMYQEMISPREVGAGIIAFR